MHPTIDRIQRISAARDDVIGLAGGLPDPSLFPRRALEVAFGAAMATPAALQYGWPEGNENMRAHVVRLLVARGVDVGIGDVIMTSGAQQALSITSSLLVRPGDRIDVGARAYPVALELFRSAGATALDGADENGRLAAHYVMPGVSNPDGVDLSATKRARILASGAPIIADEAYAELRFDGTVPSPFLVDARDRTWHVGTFSKTLCPGLRIGYLVPPPAWRAAALEAKEDADLQAGSLSQAVLERFLAVEDYDAHLRRARLRYNARSARMLEAIRRWMPGVRAYQPEGGFSIFVDTLEPGDDEQLLALAAARGVSFDPGRLFFPETPPTLTLRISHSAVAIDELEEGIRRLARALDDLRSESHGSARSTDRLAG